MSEEGKKYGASARGLWRRVYGYQNTKPQLVEVVDVASATTRSIDLAKTLRHRDFYYIDGITANYIPSIPPPPIPTGSFAEYDEGIIFVNTNAFSYMGNFNFTFSNNPIVVLSIEDALPGTENVNLFGINPGVSNFTFGFSSDFSGSIRYRAIYSPTYPALATSSFTASMSASAGSVNPGGLAYYTASFAALPLAPFEVRQTIWVEDALGEDVAFITQVSSSSEISSDLSSEFSKTVHYIAFN